MLLDGEKAELRAPDLSTLEDSSTPSRWHMLLHHKLKNPEQTKPMEFHTLVTIVPQSETLYRPGWSYSAW